MNPWMVFYAALVNWFVTFVFVESHLFAPLRNWIVHESLQIRYGDKWHHIGNRHWFEFPLGTTQEEADAVKHVMRGPWAKAGQLVTCHACTRVWIGFAEALYFGGPDHHWAAVVANGLLFAAGGHLIFEMRSRIALVEPVTSVSEND